MTNSSNNTYANINTAGADCRVNQHHDDYNFVNLNNEKISKDSENQFIFTGLQIINRSVFMNEGSEVFSLNKIWNKLIKDKNLLGLESNQKFYHLNTSDMYRKIQSLNTID